MFRSFKLIFTRKLTAFAMFLLISNLALAANIDFKTINNNASKNCTNNHTKENCVNVNGSDSACQPDRSNESVASYEASKHEPCTNLKTDESYVEPKFSTKRPRGQ